MKPALAKLRWYWKRAKVMRGRELAHRLRRIADERSLRLQWRLRAGICRRRTFDQRSFVFCIAPDERLDPSVLGANISDEEALGAISGEAPALGFSWRWTDDNSIWHEAPDTKRLWPRTFFGKIPYRPGNPYGDARVVWEPSRLQQLIVLAMVARSGPSTRAEPAKVALERQFLSWIEANPSLAGVHYVSAMECALRIIAVCHALDLARRRLARDSAVWVNLPQFIWVHARLIERRLSLYSSLGNHTIAEAVGLIYAGCLFPEFAPADRWRRRGTELLAREAARQILPDGGGIEQAFWYHLFVVDLCGLAVSLLERSRHAAPTALIEALARGRRFLAAFATSASCLPTIGDSDGGWALSPHLAISWQKAEPCAVKTAFPVSGYTKMLLSRRLNGFVLLDHGPLGMRPACGHGHADALSLTLYVGGEAILIDPGTYGYGLDAEIRRYFRGTRAHNTVIVDEADQALQETAFQWSLPFTARAAISKDEPSGSIAILARHDGYAGRGVIHWRCLFMKPEAGFVVHDFISGRGSRGVAAHWHFGVNVCAVNGGARFLAKSTTGEIAVETFGGAPSIVTGATAPMLGWRSQVYGVKRPSPTLRVEHSGALPHTFTTRVRIDGAFGQLHGEEAALKSMMAEVAHG